MALYDMVISLQYQLKARKAEVAAFKSGDKYRQMEQSPCLR